MMRNNRTIVGVLGLAATVLLSGCGWFDSSTPPANLLGARPGADRLAPVTKALPPPDSGHPHESGVAPGDETLGARTGAPGAIVSGKGGQKAQKEAAEKQAIEQSRKDREAREREAAARKAAPTADQPSSGQPSSGQPSIEQSPAPAPAKD